MEIAIIVVTIVLSLAVIATFVTMGVITRRKISKRAACEVGEACKEEAKAGGKKGFKEWWNNHKPSKRRLIQVYAALLFNASLKGYVTGDIYKGNTKYMCVPSLNCYSCPGAVGACPLGSLQNALRDTKHTAPYYVLGIIAIFCLVLARTICGFLCPAGLLQELLYKIRTPKLKKSKVTRVLSYFKYVVLAVLVLAIPIIYGIMDMTLPAFCKYICPSGTFGGAIGLLSNPTNADIFGSLGPLFTWKFCVLVAVCVASVFIYRAFCRFICPLGAIYGFFNRIALLGVKLDKDKCTDCGLCVTHCKMDIRKVGDHECINCGACIPICPAKAISWKGSQIFVRGTSVSEVQTVEVKPLTEFLNTPAAATVAAEVGGTATVETAVKETVTAEAAAEVGETAVTSDVETTESASVVNEEKEKKPAAKPKVKRGRKFWLELTAWLLALGVLLAALICYNVDFKKGGSSDTSPPGGSGTDETTVGYKVGETCPDFTLDLYNSEEEYNLYEHRGKITLINFWYIGCGGCEKEMPYIGELSNSEEYDVEIVAIHGLYNKSHRVEGYLEDSGWDQYDIKFAQDIPTSNNSYQTFRMLGGTSFWPLTVILDEEGIVRYNSTNEFHSFEQLKTVIDGIINGD